MKIKYCNKVTHTRPVIRLCNEIEMRHFEIAYPKFSQRISEGKPFWNLSSTMGRIDIQVFLGEGQLLNQQKEALRVLAAEIHRHIVKDGWTSAFIQDLSHRQKDCVQAFTEGFLWANYVFSKYLTAKPTQINELLLKSESISVADLERMEIVSDASYRCRDWVNEPVSALSAPLFASSIETEAKAAGVEVEVWNKARIQAERMGGLLAVNRGSKDEPRLVILKWLPADCTEAPIVLVGKGIVFDSGGMNLKPGNSMEDMKHDMAGAALMAEVVISAARLRLDVPVVAILPLTDNMPNQNAFCPGDILTMRNGKTVEVNNTDAEGRLILADALDLAAIWKPRLVVEASTLTGAAIRAVGPHAMVAMQENAVEALAHLATIGETLGERLVELPLWDEYDEELKSPIADLRNCGDGSAGAITAGKFLTHFVKYPYIHLDIAGVAFHSNTFKYYGKGASAFGLRSLVEFIESYTITE